MFLWELEKEVGPEMFALEVALHLDKWGAVIGDPITTPYSRVYRIQARPNSYPQTLYAKAPWFAPDEPCNKARRRLERLVREVENTIRVMAHPCIHRFGTLCFIYEVPFLISAGRDGTLEDLVNEKSLSLLEAIVIGIQITRGLNYCHSKGLISHQDLKPSNILISRLDRRFGSDFPIKHHAQVTDFELSNAYFELGIASGGRPYMSPEQHAIESEPNQTLRDFSRSDVFSFGVLLHEMVTDGLHPVGEMTRDIWPNPIEGKTRWKRSDPWRAWVKAGTPICKKLDTIPPEIYHILEQCLEVDAACRPTMSNVENLLHEYLRSADPGLVRGLRLTVENWEEVCGITDPSYHWEHGDHILATLRNYYATLR